MKKLIILLAVLAFSSISLSACSTVEGVGKDIQKGGKAIEKEAQKNS